MALANYCILCGCYIPDGSKVCLACGHTKGEPARAGQSQLNGRYQACSEFMAISYSEEYGRIVARGTCSQGTMRYELRVADVENRITEAQVMDRLCAGCRKRKN